MSRHHKAGSAIRTEQERGLKVTTVRRETPDLEILAHLICQMAMEDTNSPVPVRDLPEPVDTSR